MNNKLVIFILGMAIIAITIAIIVIGSRLSLTLKKQTEEIQLIAESMRSEVIIGEPIDIKLRMRNMSSEPITVIQPKINQVLDGWSLRGYITTLEGEEKIIEIEPVILLSQPRILEKKDFIQLNPGQEIGIDVRFDSPIHRQGNPGTWQLRISPMPTGFYEVRDDILKESFSEDGEYTVKFVFKSMVDEYLEFDDKGRGQMIKVTNAWIGKVFSNEIKIKVGQK